MSSRAEKTTNAATSRACGEHWGGQPACALSLRMVPAAAEACEAPPECAPDTARTSPYMTDLSKQVSDVKSSNQSPSPPTPSRSTIRRSSPPRAALTTPKATIRRSSPNSGFALRRSCSFDSLPKTNTGGVASQQEVGVHTDMPGEGFAVRVPALSPRMPSGVEASKASPECDSSCALDAARSWLLSADLSKQAIDRSERAAIDRSERERDDPPSPPPKSLRTMRRSNSFDRLILRKKVEVPTSDDPVVSRSNSFNIILRRKDEIPTSDDPVMSRSNSFNMTLRRKDEIPTSDAPVPPSPRLLTRSKSFDRLMRRKPEISTSDAPVPPSPKLAGTPMRRSLSFGSLPQRRPSLVETEERAEVAQLLATGELKVQRGRRRITSALSLCRLVSGGCELRSAHAIPCFLGKGGKEAYELPWSSVTGFRSTDATHEFELVYQVVNRGGKAGDGVPTISEQKVALYASGGAEFEKWRRAFVELQKEARLQREARLEKLREAGGRVKKGQGMRSEARQRAAEAARRAALKEEAARRAALKKDAEELTMIAQLPPQPSKQMDMLQHLVAGGQYASFVARAPQASAV